MFSYWRCKSIWIMVINLSWGKGHWNKKICQDKCAAGYSVSYMRKLPHVILCIWQYRSLHVHYSQASLSLNIDLALQVTAVGVRRHWRRQSLVGVGQRPRAHRLLAIWPRTRKERMGGRCKNRSRNNTFSFVQLDACIIVCNYSRSNPL